VNDGHRDRPAEPRRAATGDDGAESASFQRDVTPVSRAHSQGRHQPAPAEGDIVPARHDSLTADFSQSGRAVAAHPDHGAGIHLGSAQDHA
jgi:hypothetical protein